MARSRSLPLAVLVLAALSTIAAAEPLSNPRALGYVKLRMTYGGKLATRATGPDARLDQLRVDVFRLPQEDVRQRVVSLELGPPGVEDTDRLGNRFASFSYDALPPAGTREPGFTAEVEVRSRVGEVREPPPFPIPREDLAAQAEYLAAGPLTAYDDAMAAAAFEAVRESRDAFDAAVLLSDWVHGRVTYDPVCGDTVRGAAWTFSNRRGTCDEFTHLFMSLCRAVGLPARYVSGYAYGTFEERDDWGPHAWAEVYLPGTGWVPFDPTYGEDGWLDPSHLKVSVSTDGNTTSERSTMRYVDVALEKSEPVVRVEVLDSAPLPPPMRIALEAPPELGARDSVAIRAQVKNLRDVVMATTLKLAFRTEKGDFSLLWGREETQLRLGPREEAVLYWVLSPPPLSLDCTEDGSGRRLCTYYQYEFALSSEVTANVSVRFAANHARTSGLRVELPKDRYRVGEELRAAVAVAEPATVYVITDVAEVAPSRFALEGPSTLRFNVRRAGTLLVYASDGALSNHTVNVAQEGELALESVSLPARVDRGSALPVNVTLRNTAPRDSQRFPVRVSAGRLVLAEAVAEPVRGLASGVLSLEVPTAGLPVGEHILTVEVGGDHPTRYFARVRVEGAPELSLSAQLPAAMVAGRPYSCLLTIANTGTSEATGIRVNITLPEGMSFSGYPYPPSLGPGEAHARAMELVAGYSMAEGNHTLVLSAEHSGGLARRSFGFEVRTSRAMRVLALMDALYKLVFG